MLATSITMMLSTLISLPLYLLLSSSEANALAQHPQNVLLPLPHDTSAQTVIDNTASSSSHEEPAFVSSSSTTLNNLLDALNVMQDEYFELWRATWPTSIDWTAAVLGTQVSAALSSLTSSAANLTSLSFDADEARELTKTMAQSDLALENVINRFFDQTSAFYFGENAISLRAQANDDMLWVVLGWLENIKFQVLHSDLRYSSNLTSKEAWHGTHLRVPAAHRARIFYELASWGWDTSLCDGGMIWSPYLTPYKNAITNELYISASIGMYLYHPGDAIDFPFAAGTVKTGPDGYPHDPTHLEAAKQAYSWLKNSNMTGTGGLYADGFHISGWQGVNNPGTRKCDELNTMAYTYNQGVILSGLRGLWLATASSDYLRDGHDLVENVIRATGWPHHSSSVWAGLGRGGVLEDACDSAGTCTQDSHTFKGIFFNHFTEFCRPLRPQEKRFLEQTNLTTNADSNWDTVYELHQTRCRTYRSWIEHNAQAALKTRDTTRKFGTWWGKQYPSYDGTAVITENSPLPPGAVDYRNYGEGTRKSGDLRRWGGGSANAASTNGRGKQPAEARSWAADARISGTGNQDWNDRGRGRTVETQSGGVAVLRALYQWESTPSLW